MEERQPFTPEQRNEILFVQLVMMFQDAAYQHMGKVMNPATQQVERDLGQAKHAIDILGMLEAKTRGNLNENEKRLLEHALFELRMNYVDEVNKGEGAGKPAEGKAPESDTPAPEASGEAAPEKAGSDKADSGGAR